MAAIMARNSGDPATGTDNERGGSIAALVRDCNALPDSRSALACRRRICEGYWGNDVLERLGPIWQDMHNVKLAGIDGIASLMELTREDGTIDYGYFAAAQDDATKMDDPTALQIFVIRDAVNAKSKGIEPIPKDEFIGLAQAIAESVKKRSTSEGHR